MKYMQKRGLTEKNTYYLQMAPDSLMVIDFKKNILDRSIFFSRDTSYKKTTE